MDLNFPPSDTNSEGDAPPLSTVRSVHPPTNHEVVVDQLNASQRVPDRMQDWLVRLATINNPRSALEQFQKLNPPAYKGRADPIQAEEWLRQIEKILGDFTHYLLFSSMPIMNTVTLIVTSSTRPILINHNGYKCKIK